MNRLTGYRYSSRAHVGGCQHSHGRPRNALSNDCCRHCTSNKCLDDGCISKRSTVAYGEVAKKEKEKNPIFAISTCVRAISLFIPMYSSSLVPCTCPSLFFFLFLFLPIRSPLVVVIIFPLPSLLLIIPCSCILLDFGFYVYPGCLRLLFSFSVPCL